MQNDEAAVLQGEKEAEKMIVEAYSALLLAFLSTERLISYQFSIRFYLKLFYCIFYGLQFTFLVYSKSIRAAISENLPDHNLASLVPVLDRFVVCCFWQLLMPCRFNYEIVILTS